MWTLRWDPPDQLSGTIYSGCDSLYSFVDCTTAVRIVEVVVRPIDPFCADYLLAQIKSSYGAAARQQLKGLGNLGKWVLGRSIAALAARAKATPQRLTLTLELGSDGWEEVTLLDLRVNHHRVARVGMINPSSEHINAAIARLVDIYGIKPVDASSLHVGCRLLI